MLSSHSEESLECSQEKWVFVSAITFLPSRKKAVIYVKVFFVILAEGNFLRLRKLENFRDTTNESFFDFAVNKRMTKCFTYSDIKSWM